MATKPIKKKTVKSNGKSAGLSSASKNGTNSAVVPFMPVSVEALRNFTPSTKSFTSSMGSAESIMKNYKEQAEKFSCNAANTAQENVEIFAKYNAQLTKGAEKLMKTVAELAKEAAERNAECFKELMACRTLNELTEAQNKMAKQNFEDAMSAVTKISEMTIKLCSEAAEPLNDKVNQAVKKMKDTMAA